MAEPAQPFRYHPDPVITGALGPQEGVPACAPARGFSYFGLVCAEEDLMSPHSDTPLELAGEFSPLTLLAFIDSDFDESAAAALQMAVAALCTEREWLLGPPEFIDVEDAGVRTVGARIQLYAPLSDSGRQLPIDIDRPHFQEVRTFIAGLARVSAESRIELGVELDDDSVGWLCAGNRTTRSPSSRPKRCRMCCRR